MKHLSDRSQSHFGSVDGGKELPYVSIVTAVYNEEAVLQEKFDCLDALDYPRDKIHIYFGSDCSSDGSNQMLKNYSKRTYVTYIPFDKRQGKIGVINQLGQIACEERGKVDQHVILYNDANVMLPPLILRKLMRHFNDKRVALVDANMMSRRLKKSGISLAERAYINREVLLKHWEGLAWGTLQGAFGGCYGLRSTYFTIVPSGFLVDDFYISFNAMLKGGAAINDLEAECYESASHDIWQEFHRKSRISAGNYQNLAYILRVWGEASSRLRFCFFSHKVIRWIGPFLMMVIGVGLIYLSIRGLVVYQWLTFMALFIGVVIPVIDLLAIAMGHHIGAFRKIRYFVMMNIALLTGFFRYVKGIQNGFWEPPKRI